MNPKRRAWITLACITIAIVAGASFLPANAVKVPTSVTKVSTTCGTCVAPITCAVEDQCVLDFVGTPDHKGYWRARQANGSVWVRLTLVNGN
jgi:hypothetical protein